MQQTNNEMPLGRRLGIAILRARVNKNLSREALSDLIYSRYQEEITPKTIGRVEGGRTNPTMKTLSLLIAALIDEEVGSLENIALTLFELGGQKTAHGLSINTQDTKEMTDE